ncbi:hypothetical protein SEPCBS119000_004579 [Sporothrix epigloea]|uniref:Tautomerase cis-CaaD-like domain-containing protein n=1 Tax=Sporothrix epigloea TaxID=1892477 RepID=A0ABP0DV17_9PEZI
MTENYKHLEFYHPPTAFATAQERQRLVDDVTKLYTDWDLPAFYVVVQFLPMITGVSSDDTSPVANFFVGGSSARAANFVRVVVHHLAFQSQGNVASHQRITSSIDAMLQPHVEAKGFDWEYHVSESPPTLWKINGLVPPVRGNAAVETWSRENKPSPYDGDGRSGE